MIFDNVGVVQVLEQVNFLHNYIEFALGQIRQTDLLDRYSLACTPLQSSVDTSKGTTTEAVA